MIIPDDCKPRHEALTSLTVPELVALLKDVHDANPSGDEDWKNAIRYALIKKSGSFQPEPPVGVIGKTPDDYAY